MWVNLFENFAQVSEAGGVWTIKTSTTLKTMELKFKVYPSVSLIRIFEHLFTSQNYNFDQKWAKTRPLLLKVLELPISIA